MASFEQHRPLSPTRVTRFLTHKEQRGWFRVVQQNIANVYGSAFSPRTACSVTISNVESLEKLKKQGLDITQSTDGSLRRVVQNSLTHESKKPVSARVLWTTRLGSHIKPHVGVALESAEIVAEMIRVEDALRSVGYTAIRGSLVGPHITLGSFSGSPTVPRGAIEILNDSLPEVLHFEPVKILRR